MDNSARAALELVRVGCDSARHHADQEQYLRDIERHDTTALFGWVEVRIGKRHLEGGVLPPCVTRNTAAVQESLGWC